MDMKQFMLYASFLFVGLNIQGQESVLCRPGFTYDVSRSPAWGMGRPVITHVYPYSPAEQAGLKVSDIIETVEGDPVEGLDAQEIARRLNPAGKSEVSLTVSSLKDAGRAVTVQKDCKRADAITEDRLAVAFSMYSVENTSERIFVCPFTTTVDTANLARYKTFAFAPTDENNRSLEETLNACIEKELRGKGLEYSPHDPDILVETFYLYNRNPNYVRTAGSGAQAGKPSVYRYDFALRRMQKFPFLSYTAAETGAEYLLQLGIRMTDKRYRPGHVVWECEANEMLSAPFRLENYAQTHIPLMFMQYPYVRYSRNVQFLVSSKAYNYTGLHYDINRLERVIDVDLNSPAHIAGIQPRDVIESIDSRPLNHTAEEYTTAYKQFIIHTMPLRNPETAFTDAGGFRYCMYWKEFDYAQVAEALRAPRFLSVFAYLYKYAPYVSPSGVNTCNFRIRRGKDRINITIRPTVHTETTVTIK
jgi:hypothetical protein